MADIRNAAAGIVIRGGNQVLLCQRNSELRFMPGAWVFPGGRIDDDEGTCHVVGADDDTEAAAIHAACREIFEETGLLCVRGDRPDRDLARAARLQVLDNAAHFDDFLAAHGLTISADDFEDAGVWTTPPMVPVRFHTRYYRCNCGDDWQPELVTGEIVDLKWIDPGEARRAWHRGAMNLPHPVAYVLQHLAVEDHPDLVRGLRQTTVSHDPRFGRIEFRCGINVLALESNPLPPATHTNCILVGSDELYIIDPGTDKEHEFEHLQVQIEHHLMTGGRVAGILLTHSHRDHIGAATFLRNEFDVPIWAHSETNRQLKFDVDQLLEDGQVIDVSGDPGWQLKCLHTPGHDPGHICFLEQNTKTLLAGDMVAQQGTIIVAPQIEGDMTDYLNSLERLLDEDFRIIIAAHGLPIAKGKEKIQETINHRLQRERKVVEALDAGLRKLDELVARVYDDVESAVWQLAEQTLLAHLARLGHRVGEDGVVRPGSR